jgi:adenosylcobinamide-GDP ribazoletransferase
MRYYFIALQFLTIIPLPFKVRFENKDLGRAMALFPLAGLTLGFLLVGCNALLEPYLPRPVADLLLILVITVVTGALHLDGLADVCDGLAARGGRERFLEVMKDSRVGAVGVVGLVIGLLLKYQALLHIPLAYKSEALLLFPLLARFSQVQMAVGARNAREEGLGSLFIQGAGLWQFAAAEIITLISAWLLFGVRGIACCLISFVATWLLKIWFQRRLGGITGDVIGCASELNEIICLLALLAMLGGR